MSLTVGDVIDQIYLAMKESSGKTPLHGHALAAVNTAVQNALVDLRSTSDWYNTKTVISVTASTTNFALPADFGEPILVERRATSGADYIEARRIGPQEFSRAARGTDKTILPSADAPVYRVIGTALYLLPVFSAVDASGIALEYYKQSTELTERTENIPVAPHHEQMVHHLAKAFCFQIYGNTDANVAAAMAWKQAYLQNLQAFAGAEGVTQAASRMMIEKRL